MLRTSPVDYFRASALEGLEVVRNRTGEGRVARHAHRCLVAGAVLAGSHVAVLDGREFQARAGDCFVIGPGRMHACRFQDGCDLECVCVPQALLDRLGPRGAEYLLPACSDPGLFRAVRRLAGLALSADSAGLEQGLEQMLNTIARLAHPESVRPPSDPLMGVLRERLRDALPGTVDCACLAREAGLAPWALSRRFTAAFGTGPRDLAMLLRVERAKELLACGASLADAGLEAGFFDQSHFCRRFSRVVGMSPGQYARAWRGDGR